MRKIAISLFVNGIALFCVDYLFKGITLEMSSLVILTVVFCVLNTLVKPILTVLSLPLTIITLGLFMLVINGIILFLAFKIVPGASCDNFSICILASIVISVVNSVLGGALKKK